MRDILQALPAGYNEVVDLERIENTNFLYGGLNIVYGLDGTGKSWQTVRALEDTPDTIYLDLDGSNGKSFVKHCTDNNVHYVKQEVIDKPGSSLIDSVLETIELILDSNRQVYDTFKPTFVIDSLTSIGDGLEINNAEKISPVLYHLNNHSAANDYGLVLIDHATEQRSDTSKKLVGFKLEGNAGAKRRTAVTVNRYEASDMKAPELGGCMICERARGNDSGLRKNDTLDLTNAVQADLLAWIQQRHPEWLTDGFKQRQLTMATKHKRDRWVRDQIELLFDMEESNQTKSYYLI